MNSGVDIVLSRMETHPEEFYGECDKWKFIYKEYFRDAMTETEKGKIFDRIKQIRMEEFTAKVLSTLVPPEEEKEDDSYSGYKSAFGSAPVKREGATITYDPATRMKKKV